MTKLAIVDTETTGLDPDRHEIWEVGLVLAADDDLGNAREISWQLPVDLGRADPMALKITRFRERRTYDGQMPVGQFAQTFAKLTDGAHLVGAVPSFDEERLRKLLRAHGECPTWHYHLIDVEAMAVGYLHGALEESDGDRQFPRPSLPWRSDDLSRECGVDPPGEDERHTALGDARWAWRWYRALVGDGVDREYITFGTTRAGELHEDR